MTLLKYFKHIEPSKEEKIQSVLPKPDCPLHGTSNAKLSNRNCLIASAIYETKCRLGRWVSVYAFIVSKHYGC